MKPDSNFEDSIKYNKKETDKPIISHEDKPVTREESTRQSKRIKYYGLKMVGVILVFVLISLAGYYIFFEYYSEPKYSNWIGTWQLDATSGTHLFEKTKEDCLKAGFIFNDDIEEFLSELLNINPYLEIHHTPHAFKNDQYYITFPFSISFTLISSQNAIIDKKHYNILLKYKGDIIVVNIKYKARHAEDVNTWQEFELNGLIFQKGTNKIRKEASEQNKITIESPESKIPVNYKIRYLSYPSEKGWIEFDSITIEVYNEQTDEKINIHSEMSDRVKAIYYQPRDVIIFTKYFGEGMQHESLVLFDLKTRAQKKLITCNSIFGLIKEGQYKDFFIVENTVSETDLEHVYYMINFEGEMIDKIGFITALRDFKLGKEIILFDTIESNNINQEKLYHFRIHYGYSDAITGTFIDNRDKQRYGWVKIGKQIWMAENVSFSVGKGSWVYDNEQRNVETYGRLYNWETSCEVCPKGWHLPSIQEWQELIDFLGGNRVAGGKLKEKGTKHWEYSNNGGTNLSEFNALPAGIVDNEDSYDNSNLKGGRSSGLGKITMFWSKTEAAENQAFSKTLFYNQNSLLSYERAGSTCKEQGLSVRCVKNNPFKGSKKPLNSPRNDNSSMDQTEGELPMRVGLSVRLNIHHTTTYFYGRIITTTEIGDWHLLAEKFNPERDKTDYVTVFYLPDNISCFEIKAIVKHKYFKDVETDYRQFDNIPNFNLLSINGDISVDGFIDIQNGVKPEYQNSNELEYYTKTGNFK